MNLVKITSGYSFPLSINKDVRDHFQASITLLRHACTALQHHHLECYAPLVWIFFMHLKKSLLCTDTE